jgi:hypothetical protein
MCTTLKLANMQSFALVTSAIVISQDDGRPFFKTSYTRDRGWPY